MENEKATFDVAILHDQQGYWLMIQKNESTLERSRVCVKKLMKNDALATSKTLGIPIYDETSQWAQLNLGL